MLTHKPPLFALIILNHLIAKIAVDQFQISTDRICMLNQTVRWIAISTNRRAPCAKNTCLFKTDGFARVPQKAHMIYVHRGYDRRRSVKHIGRIQTTTQANLEHQRIRLLGIKPAHEHQQRKFKISQRDFRRLHTHTFNLVEKR